MTRSAAALIGTLAVLLAGTAGASSLFSPLGVGTWVRNHNAYSSAVSGANLAVIDSVYFPLNNPAGWRSYGVTKFSVSMISDKTYAEDATGSDVSDSFSFPYAAITTPIYRSLGVGVLYQSLTDHDYLLFSRSTHSLDDPVDTVQSYDILRRVQGDGGLSRAGARIALKITDRIVIGGGLNYYFGSLEELTTTDFEQGEFNRSGRFVSHDLSGLGGEVGVMYTPNRTTAYSLSATLPTTMDIESSVTIEGGDSTGTSGLNYELPLVLDAAVAHTIDRVRLMGRVSNWTWSNTEHDITGEQSYTDAYRVSVGIERLPLHEPLVPWFDVWTFRAGGHLSQDYVEAAGNPVQSWGVSLGVGIPVAGGRGMLDTALWFDARGNVDDNAAREHIYGLQISITATERWFSRRDR